MNEVPFVVYPVGRSYRLGVALWALWLIGVITAVIWLAHQTGGQPWLTWRVGLMVSAVALSGAALYRFWSGQSLKQLVFNGDGWQLNGASMVPQLTEPAFVAVVCDAQRAMMLRWPATKVPGVRSFWLWADAASDPRRWHLFRCALYSPANRPAQLIAEELARS